MSTPLSDLLSLVAAHGKSQASAFLQGEAVIAGSPDQEIWEHLAQHDILWDGLTVDDQDRLRDEYLEGFKQECARRLTPSDPDACESATSMEQFRIAHRAQIKLLREKLKDCESALERAERSPAASGVIPAPLVPDAVKAAQELLERLGRGYRPDHEIHGEISQCITALRNYSPAPSPSVPKEVLSPEELKRRNYHEIYG